MVTDDQLAILRHARGHEGVTANSVARQVLGAPRTTFGRRLKLPQAGSELERLVGLGLIEQVPGRGRTEAFVLTDAGRDCIRGAALDAENQG